MLPLGLYLRLSLEGEGAGIQRQREDTEQLCKKLGRTGVLYVDEASAYQRRIKRPQFERLLSDLEDGVIGGVVVWDIDRLARQPKDMERLIEVFEGKPLIFGTCQGELDLTTSDGRFIARLLVSVANKSSADTGRRVARAHLQLAQAGIPVGGTRPFGWKTDKRTLEPAEARLIREAAASILAGKGLHTICKEWNAAGIRTAKGNLWVKPALRNMLLSPRLVGQRVYRGEAALDASGEPVRGLHEPILDQQIWEAVKAVLTDPARSGPHVHIGGRKYLLSGIARCALCSALLQGNADTKWGTFYYACRDCGKVGISGPKTDALISELVIRYLSQRRVETEAQPWPGEDQLSDVTGRIAELMSAYTQGKLSGQMVFPSVAELDAQARSLRGEQASWLREQVAVSSRPTNITEAWPSLAVEQRRAVIESVIPTVAVRPAAKRGGRFEPDRVVPVWRAQQPLAAIPHPSVLEQ